MFKNDHYTFDELQGLHARLESLHEESRALSERINSVDMQIKRMLLSQCGTATEPTAIEACEGDDPPFHLVGA